MWLVMWVLLLGVGSALAQEAGEIVSVLGVAEVLREDRWQAVGAGEKLAAGEVVRAGADSRIAIQLENGSQLKLNAGSQLELKAVTPPSGGVSPASSGLAHTILRFLGGEMWVRSVGEPLEVQTVPATATIRGTEFGLAVDPGDLARLAVLEGVVEFSNPQGNVLVAANEQATAKAGEAPRKTV
ncbi:MAG TPA: FecR family protein, partial [Candidatus Competibacter sp.]|nr:FecR family protein [Candidatus Competibacter sp.]